MTRKTQPKKAQFINYTNKIWIIPDLQTKQKKGTIHDLQTKKTKYELYMIYKLKKQKY